MRSAIEVLGVHHEAVDPLPAGSCDCHTHVFEARFPLDPGRQYTPGEATTAELLAHQRALGLDRVVIVQPSPYGTDNACTLEAIRALGGRARAVAVVDPALPRAGLDALHASGVRGVRVNLETGGEADPEAAGRLVRAAAVQVAPLGWHVQVYSNLGMLAALHPVLRGLPVPLVIDHFGRADAAAGAGQPGFDTLLDLVGSGRAYVKLSATHRIAPDPSDAAPIARALLAANPARMLWGSDWPHPGAWPGRPRQPEVAEPFHPVDDGAALNRVLEWAGDAATIRAILVDNPARLYDF